RETSAMRALLAVVVLFNLAAGVAAQSGSSAGPVARREPRPAVAPGIATRTVPARVAQEGGSILANQCVSCHGPEKKKGGLDLTRRASALAGGDSGAVIVPGQPDESLLIEKVAGGEMPPKGPLPEDQVAAVRALVEAGG